MRIIDLSHEIAPAMPTFPGTRPPVFRPANTIDDDGFREMRVDLCTHTGTHIDSPFHVFPEGRALDSFDADHFFGRATMVDLRSIRSKDIGLDLLKRDGPSIRDSDFLLIHTGWQGRWGTDSYFEGFPSLSAEAAEWLSGMDLKGVGVDAISIDDIGSVDLEVHKTLLASDILIIENLNSLDNIRASSFFFSCMPLRLKDADGSPIRAYAMEE
ncbi:MAG TPA: cyclase family protein [Candidatus Methanofastidiosa archaeon]|nr:cyclase family protein [Candidatus Methanofastidiosa archaeon]